MRNYELVKMKLDKSIKDIYTRFTDIVNAMKGIRKKLPNGELMIERLRSLPKSWEVKVTTIEEAKDLSKLSMEALIGSLKTHEIKGKGVFNDKDGQKKSIALKASTLYESESSDRIVIRRTIMTLCSLPRSSRRFH